MKQQHWKKAIALGVSMLLANTCYANQGLAFVHGTGNQTDAYNDYWTSDMVDSVRQGLPNANKFTVINCDFDQYMWDERASGCLADQLSSFVSQQQITQLTLITHSNGGNVVRWMMSNPTWDARFPVVLSKLNKVIALAPSSGGTPLADAVISGNVFESSLGWLLGFSSDAVRQQQVAWMAFYNDNWLHGTSGRPSLSHTFEVVVGSDVDSAIWDGDSYCAGYQNQVALEVTQNWLDNCSDGFLECSSQQKAGTTWFVDKQKTRGSEPLSHQQSRRNCFNLDTLLRNRI